MAFRSSTPMAWLARAWFPLTLIGLLLLALPGLVLLLLTLIYAVMGFHIHGRNTEGAHYILLIDNSASMSASDVAPNRLEWARLEALKEIDAAGDDDFGMVIAFNSK